MTRVRALRIGAALLLLLLLVALLLAARFALQPARVAGFVLSNLGSSLGLEITATGDSTYTLRGGPVLVVRGVTVRQPSSSKPLLTAARVLVSVPWSTVRSRGSRLDITRIELDAPVLDIAALQRWLAGRPSGDSALPTLRDGLQVNSGRIDGDGWRVDALDLTLPRFAADRPLTARVAGRYRGLGRRRAVDESLSVRFDVTGAATRPANDAGLAVIGRATANGVGWRVPLRLRAAGLLHGDDAGARIPRLRMSVAGTYERVPARPEAVPPAFVVSVTSPLAWSDDTLTLAPAGLAVRGGDAPSLAADAQLVPALDAGAAITVRMKAPTHVDVALDGRLAQWPGGWPALPSPLSASTSPLPIALRYAGAVDGSDPLALRLQRDATRFDARLRVAEVTAWATADAASPLPPISGTLVSPRLDVAGLRLEGVEVVFDEPLPAVPRPLPAPTR